MPEVSGSKHIGLRVAEKILGLAATGKTIPEIAQEMGLDTGRVWCVVHGITWQAASGKRRPKVYGEVTRAKAKMIMRLRKLKATIQQLSNASNLSETTVRYICKGGWSPLWDKRADKSK